ncbi:hypothetical protein AKJ16_DCAP25257, partial [Drosera capensis]
MVSEPRGDCLEVRRQLPRGGRSHQRPTRREEPDLVRHPRSRQIQATVRKPSVRARTPEQSRRAPTVTNISHYLQIHPCLHRSKEEEKIRGEKGRRR